MHQGVHTASSSTTYKDKVSPTEWVTDPRAVTEPSAPRGTMIRHPM